MVRSGELADRSAERTPSYWAVLAAAFVVTAAPGVAFGQAPVDAGATALAQQSDSVALEADVLIDDQTAKTITAEGNVEVQYQGRTLRAERLTYNLNTGTILASGGVEIVGDDGTAQYAEEMQVDEGLNLGVASELRARMGANSMLAARSAIRVGEGESELRNVVYTSCPVCEAGDRPPTWSLRARRAVQDNDSRTISYRGTVLEVVGVPVLYLPFFAHPDPSVGRSSGFLTPDVGRNQRLGTFYRQPYYWAISPYQDVTASIRTHTHVMPIGGLDYRKRFWSGDLEVNTTFTREQEFDSRGHTFGDDTARSSVFARGNFRVDDYWRWGFGAERISDDLYLRRYDLTGTGEVRGPLIGDTTRLVSQLYAIGQDDSSYTSVSLVSFQGLRANDNSSLLPLILPNAEYDRVFADPVFRGQLRLQANTAVLQRSVGLDTARGSVSGSWRTDTIFGPGMVFSPFALARADIFHQETSPEEYETFSRGLGLAGAEISWPFMRAGEAFDFMVEPVAMAAYGTNEQPDPRIINEDSIGFELDDSNLFRPNAAPNYDLWEPGSRLSLGFRATARTRAGQSASLLFGRRWRGEAAPGFTVRNNLEGRATDWVAAVQTDLGRNFASEVRFRLEDETLELQRLDAGVRAAYGRFSATARYFSIDEVLAPGNPSEEISASVGVELARGWRMAYALRRDLDSGINLTQDIRAIYEDDCTFLEITYSRSETLDRSLGPDEGLQIRVGLRSLGLYGGGG